MNNWEEKFDKEIGCESAEYFGMYRDEMIERTKEFIRNLLNKLSQEHADAREDIRMNYEYPHKVKEPEKWTGIEGK